MNILDSKEKILLVVDKDYYPLIFNLKNRYPNSNIKIINKNELIDKAGYRFSIDPIPYLIKEKRIDYSKAKKYLHLIRCLRGSKINPFIDLINELKGYITVDEYGLYELMNYKIYLFEMDEDEEIKTLLNNQNISFSLLHLSDLEIEKHDNLTKTKIIHFSNKFAQFGHIFSDIRKKIKENPDVKEHIVILTKDDSDSFYIYSLGKLFGIDIYSIDKTPLLSNPKIAKAINNAYQNKKIVFEKDEDLKPLIDLVKQYRLDEIDDFEFAYSNLLEILSSQKNSYQHGDRGVVITTNYVFDPDDLIYVTNFEFGCFYKEYTDNNVLSDSELRELHLTTSFNKTALDKRKKSNYLMYNNIALLSRVKQHQNDSIYDSHFLTKELKKKVTSVDKNKEINEKGEFTSSMNLLTTAHLYDQSYFNQKHHEYRSYDHSYKGIKANDLMEKEFWSVTDLEKYYDCPFKYLLDKLIPLPSDLHHAYRGTFIHSLLEDIMHDDFDFDKSFEKGKKSYINNMNRNNEPFTEKEEAWLQIYKYWLSNMIPSLRRIKDHMNYHPISKDYELPVYFEIDGYKFKGIIDKLICTDNADKTYYTIVDYKTGAENYDDMSLAVGKSIQLPLYYYALNEFNKKNDYVDDFIFGGFLIQHPYFKTIKEAFVNKNEFSEGRLLYMSRYSGVSLNDELYASSFDNTVYKNNGEFNISKGTFLNGKLSFTTEDDDSTLLSRPPLGLDKFNLIDTINLAKRSAKRIIEKIKNNEYEIAPSGKDISKPLKLDSLKCTYCSHRDICYVNPIEDARDYTKFIRDEISGKGGNDNE